LVDSEPDEAEIPAQYSGQRSGRRVRSRKPGNRRLRGRLRILYFSLASAWGFLSGSAGVFLGLEMLHQPVRLEPLSGFLLGGAALAALAGGLVAAAAYREATRRH
jgi:hypothetical protein